jgi:hypothetical protein
MPDDSPVSETFEIKVDLKKMMDEMSRIPWVRTSRPPVPPSKSVEDATRGLALQRTRKMTDRQIAFEVQGACKHICPACNDAIRSESIPSGIRQRKRRERCASCDCTIRAENKRERVCGKCFDVFRARMRRLKVTLRKKRLQPEPPLVEICQLPIVVLTGKTQQIWESPFREMIKRGLALPYTLD